MKSQAEYLTKDLYHESTKKKKTRNNYKNKQAFVPLKFSYFRD